MRYQNVNLVTGQGHGVYILELYVVVVTLYRSGDQLFGGAGR